MVRARDCVAEVVGETEQEREAEALRKLAAAYQLGIAEGERRATARMDAVPSQRGASNVTPIHHIR